MSHWSSIAPEEHEQVGRYRGAEDADRHEPVIGGVVGWQRRHCASRDRRPIGFQHHGRDDETQRHQAQHRHAFLDETERAFPEQQPCQKSHRQSPPLEAYARGKFECDGNAADLGGEHHETEQQGGKQRPHKDVETKSLADAVADRVMAHRGEPAGHFHQKDDADGAEDHGPDQLEAEGCARLGRRRHRSDFKEAANAGNHAKRYLHELLHGFGAKYLA